jgi:hypothetical protein
MPGFAMLIQAGCLNWREKVKLIYTIVKRGRKYRLRQPDLGFSGTYEFWPRNGLVFETEDLEEAKKELEYANSDWTEVKLD